MAAEIRIGKVSKVDYKNGQVSVLYEDLDGEVTDLLPYSAFNNEYHMPAVEDWVLVVHLRNGVAAGVVLGTYWGEENKPPVHGKDLYRKDYSNKAGKAYTQYDPSSGQLTIKADKIVFQTSAGNISVAQIISHLASH